MVTAGQALVVLKVDSAIHWIVQSFSPIFIPWIVLYLVDSAIQRLNNVLGLVDIIPYHMAESVFAMRLVNLQSVTC